jgi:ribonucleoside-diphosphate reductase alpha subunit
MPYIVNIDEVNGKSNHKHYGKIHQSNLCAEINQFQDANTTSQCCLGSIPVQKFIKEDGTYDFISLKNVSKETSKILNEVINKNKYSTEKGKKGGLEQRAIGIGLQGLADTFCMMEIGFDSQEAKSLNVKISEAIYFGALEGSVEYFEETGMLPYKFEKSDYAKGILQYDYHGKTNQVEENSIFNWKFLKEKIKKGCSNSLVTAYMPTANTAQIIGSNEAFEPFTDNIYVRDTAAGEFYVINKHLIKDLEKLNLWNDEMCKVIVANKGKLFTLPNDNEYVKDLLLTIPKTVRERYKTVWEISQKIIIDYAADRSIFIDQSQSMNLFIEKPTSSIISSMLMYSAKKSLKTCVYYMRGKAGREANSTMGLTKTIGKKVEKPKESLFNCEGCSA